MYISRLQTVNFDIDKLKQDALDFLEKYSYCNCSIFKRKVFFDKMPDVVFKRKNAKHRLKCFRVSVDIIKKSSDYTKRIHDGCVEYEIFGESKDCRQIFAHIREEIDGKDKKLQFVSCFHRKNSPPLA